MDAGKVIMPYDCLPEICKNLAVYVNEHLDKKDNPGVVVIGINSGGKIVLDELIKHYSGSGNHPEFYSLTGLPDGVPNWTPLPINGQQGSDLNCDLDGKVQVIVDGAMNTGETIVFALNETGQYGRPGEIKIAVIYDGENVRAFPVEADFWAYRGKPYSGRLSETNLEAQLTAEGIVMAKKAERVTN